jgi:chromosome partitioning protein
MKSIMIFNQKGGVGKSTTAANLIAEFTRANKRVLGIDLDGQGHLTQFLNFDTTDKNTTLELLLDKATFDDTVVKTKYCDLIPADSELQKNEPIFAQKTTHVFKIRQLLKEVKDKYDYVVIDCPPAINSLTSSALIGVDYLIIPTEAEKFAIDGVSELIDTVREVKGEFLNPNLKVLGLLITKYNKQRKLSKEVEVLLADVAVKYFDSKLFDIKIPNLSDVPYSQTNGLSLYDFKPKSNATLAYHQLASEILRGIE